MNLRELARVSLSKTDVERLCGLPQPDAKALAGAPKQMLAAMDNLFDLWVQILVKSAPLPIDAYSYTCPHGHEISYDGLDLRGRLLLTIGGYFESLYSMWLTTDRYRSSLPVPKAFKIASFSEFTSWDLDDQDEDEAVMRRLQLCIMSHKYFFSMSTLYFSAMFFRTHAPRGQGGQFESMAHETLLGLFEDCFSLQGVNERILARRLMKGALHLAQNTYSDIAAWNASHKLGAFSALRVGELSLLAARDESMQKRYGRKNVEKAFEQQLALVLQSLGLYVVSTRTGQSTVDLVCISSSSEERITFLVEAKTSKAPYPLPKKDARALRDYVADTRRSLSSLPPLTFVLIVAASCTRTLEAKLAALEAQAAVPVRFMSAQQLANLRERIAGPLPLRIFTQELLVGGRILDDALVDRVASAYQSEQAAHRAFVESMLSARGVIKTGKDWAAHEHPSRSCDG